MSELKARHAFDVYEEYTKTGDDEQAQVYLKSEADKVISTIRAERDEYRYNLSCARNEIHNMQIPMSEYIKRIADKDKVIAELKADYREACDRLQTANLIKDEQLAATRHSKRKRCLAMAQVLEHVCPITYRKARWQNKWYQRWLELAERFK
ncbi:hypothetical protein SAMN05720470_10819 [Fibrobacter sp. UWOV1]|uniref:hypothetical protein n=1 Tax=Fibrobacter sp. UWOV1 TaxID=1896215 RepID=UPI00091F6DFC|nr:hypothetical protein [Fibrobacter sp. UWOV1]SHL41426.1 hypothetical protein SAMN05720470_10819 [Fibrobacter sp. UWOV1]